MKQNKMECSYSIIEKLHTDNLSHETFDHLMDCSVCQNEIMKIDEGFLYLKNTRLQKIFNYQNENELSEFTESILDNKTNFPVMSQDVINVAIEHAVFLKNYDKMENIPTPEFLKQMVISNISEKKENVLGKIIIKISDGLKVVGNYIENMYVMPDFDNLVQVRSKKSDDKNRQSTLNFFQKKEKNEIIRYHIVQDGPESILLTIKLENFESQPLSLSIRNHNQLVASQPFTNSYAYFHKLKTGDYQFEVNFSGTGSAFVIPLCII